MKTKRTGARSLAIAAAGSLAMAAQSSAALQLYWSLDGTPVADGSGNGNTGTAGSTVTFTSPSTTTGLNSSTPGTVANFDGGSAISSNANASTLDIDGSKPKSISVWVDAASSTWSGSNGVFEIGNNSYNQDFSLRVRTAGEGGGVNDWRGQFWGSDIDFTVDKSADHWVHFVVIYDPTTATYANQETIFANNTVVGTGSGTLATASSPKNFAVGEWSGNNLTGQIDDVAVFDSVLSPSDVNALYNGASPTALPEPASLALLAGGGVLTLLRRRRA